MRQLNKQTEMADFIKINPTDNVIIALKDFSTGDKLVVDGQELEIKNDVPKGHKIALTAIAENEDIINMVRRLAMLYKSSKPENT